MKKILIANRGEIACRVIRTARAMGYRSVVVHSDADANSLAVRQADETVRIGPSPAAQSYLNIPALLDAAKKSGADAVHPGYGFLSENAAFAQACIDAGLSWIGPPPEAIAAMGDKAGAKQRMIAAGVPTVPGYLGEDGSDARLTAEAAALGFPLLVKAVAGGGGRGMRLARSAQELPEALAGARREAQSAFGDGRLMLERLIERGRHIEIQVFADAHGNAVHLGERDCTAQRRRQKVIEEAPSPVVSPVMREAMGRDAVAAALAVGYRGAGTVEFIVDAHMTHYFLEMNTRLQVEHPVTEMITGLDLVEWQLRVAEGQTLPLRQEEIRFTGHAIEARLYAEDPYQGFAPQTGRVLRFAPPAMAIRIDTGIAEGDAITPHYDPMVAKFIAHGRDRDEAIRKLMAALEDAPLLGVANNGRFLHDLLDHDDFRNASLHTARIDEWMAEGDALLQAPQPSEDDWLIATAAFVGEPGWRSPSVADFGLRLQCGEETRTMRSDAARGIRIEAIDDRGSVRVIRDGHARRLILHRRDDTLWLARDAAVFVFREVAATPRKDNRSDPRYARASVAGTVARVDVREGDAVTAGQTLALVEAMKMEMRVVAGADGIVARVATAPGRQIEAGAVLIELTLKE